MVVWVNCHGSFVIGLLLVGLWLVDESLASSGDSACTKRERPFTRRLIAATAALATASLACLLNPGGPGILSYVTDLTSNAAVQGLVPEWAPPSFWLP